MDKFQRYADYLLKIYINHNINYLKATLYFELKEYCLEGEYKDARVIKSSPEEKHIKLLNSFRKDIVLFIANEENNIIHIEWCEDWILTPHERALRDIKNEIGEDEDEKLDLVDGEFVPIIKTKDLERIRREIGL
jgi:uncharacterized protein (UPF0371 family)